MGRIFNKPWTRELQTSQIHVKNGRCIIIFSHSFLFSVFWHGYTFQENKLYYFWNGTGHRLHTGARTGSVGPQKEGSGFKSWPCGFFLPPRTCTWGKWWFKLPLSGVNESVNGCLFQCFSPVMSWRPIQGVAPPAQRRLGPHKGIKWYNILFLSMLEFGCGHEGLLFVMSGCPTIPQSHWLLMKLIKGETNYSVSGA